MTSLSRIYRIEHCQTGNGPYQNLATADVDLLAMVERHSKDDELHPVYTEDVFVKGCGICPDREYLESLTELHAWCFGFRTMYQLRSWFTDEELSTLHHHGFNLVVYELRADSYCNLRKQSVFNKKEAIVAFKQNVISLIRNK